MNRICNILVFVDPTVAAHPCVDKAAALASKFNARLELYVCDTRVTRDMRLMRAREQNPNAALTVNLKPMLEELARPLRQRGIDVCTECEYASVLHEGLIDRAKRTIADLIVKETHHHSLAQRTFLTNTDWELIRGSPIPLLLTKERPWHSLPRILAALDPAVVNDKPESLDQEILDYASQLSQRLGAELHAAHAYVPIAIAATADAVMAPMATTLDPSVFEIEEKQQRTRLRAVTESYRIPPERLHLELGVASEVLPSLAHTINADILVMGAVSRRGLAKIFIGSTAERALERLPCDVLVVKPPDFAAALPIA
ncbi:MAG TPA: universal stress protein [Steroidobacteraceae bacterium]|nr:universal stress protein [Steroidobacteraceae bacterium]